MTTELPIDLPGVPDKLADKPEVMKSASDLLSQGKRSMVCGEIPQAVDLYQEAVQLLVKSCGELSRDCAYAYFCCGSALLELGRMETQVLGVALQGVDVEEEKDVESSEQFEKPPEDDGEERHKLREDVYEAMAEGEREEELHKSVKKKSGAAGVIHCETSTGVAGMETDQAHIVSTEKQTTQAGNGGAPTDETTTEHLVTASSEGTVAEEGGATAADGKKQEESRADITEQLGSSTAESTAQQADGDTSAHQNTATTADSQVTPALTTAGQEEEQMDTSSTTISEQSITTGDSAGEKVSQNKADDSTDNKTVLGDSPTESDACKQACPSEHPVGDLEQETCAEKIVTEAVKEACQKLADDEAHTRAALADDATDKADADVEMADEDDDADDDADDDVNSESDNEENRGEKADDVPNFQLAWEYLELAKVIYLKSESVEDQLKAADCHIKLGELSMETEQYSTAAADLETALKIQQKHLPANDRLIAETHYQLGLAYGFGGEYEQSIQQYTTAISVLQSKIESLSQLVKEKEANGENKENAEVGELKKYQDEIKELQDLIPEINNKVEDMRLEAREVLQVKQMAQEAMGFPPVTQETDSSALMPKMDTTDTSAGDSVGPEQQAGDIGHLVRKKRKPDTDLADEAQEIKKIRPDNCGDGSSEVLSQKPVGEAAQPDVAETADKSADLRTDSGAPTAGPAAGLSEMVLVAEISPSEPAAGAAGEASSIELPVSELLEASGETAESAPAHAECEMVAVGETSQPEPVSEKPNSEAGSDTAKPEPVSGEPVVESSETSKHEPVSGEPVVEISSETSKPEPVSGEPVVESSETSKPEPVSGEPVVESSETSKPEPVSGEPVVESSETSKPEPVSGEPVVEANSETSKPEPLNEKTVVDTISETSKPEAVKEDSDMSTAMQAEVVHGFISEALQQEPESGKAETDGISQSSAIEPLHVDSQLNAVSKSSHMELVHVESQVDEVIKSSTVEPLHGETEMDTVITSSASVPVNGESEMDTVITSSASVPVNGESEMDTVITSSASVPVNGESEMDTVITSSKSVPVNGESEMDIISKSSSIEPVNGDSLDLNGSSKIEPVNGDSIDVVEPVNGDCLDVVNESSKPLPVNGESEAKKQLADGATGLDTKTGECQLEAAVIEDSCGLNSRDEVSMETETTAS